MREQPRSAMTALASGSIAELIWYFSADPAKESEILFQGTQATVFSS